MKSRITIILAGAMVLGGCFAQKQPKVVKRLPDEMLPHVKESYSEMWDKGKILYELNCAECHNQKVKGKWIVPEFTEEMLAAYEIRVADPKHEMAISDVRVTTEELTLINVFLVYREHDSVALKKLLAMPRDHTHDASM